MVHKKWKESKNILSNWTVWWMTSPLLYGSRHSFEVSLIPFLEKLRSWSPHYLTPRTRISLRLMTIILLGRTQSASIALLRQRWPLTQSTLSQCSHYFTDLVTLRDPSSPSMLRVFIKALGWYYLKPWIAVTFSVAFAIFIPIYLVKNLVNFSTLPS